MKYHDSDPDAAEVFANLIGWVKHNINITDPDFLEAYEKVTDLLQAFIDRQCQLRKYIKENGNTKETEFEHKTNAEIIRFIQWVRYHLWGNDDITIMNKTGMSNWTFHISITAPSYYIYQSPFACQILGFDNDVNAVVSAKDIVEAILNIITPKREHSIFALDDQVTESMTLKYELDRIKSKINP